MLPFSSHELLQMPAPRRRQCCGRLFRPAFRGCELRGIAEGCGGAAVVKLVEAVVGPGLGTSKTIGYAPPLPKRYNGDLVRFAP